MEMQFSPFWSATFGTFIMQQIKILQLNFGQAIGIFS